MTVAHLKSSKLTNLPYYEERVDLAAAFRWTARLTFQMPALGREQGDIVRGGVVPCFNEKLAVVGACHDGTGHPRSTLEWP